MHNLPFLLLLGLLLCFFFWISFTSQKLRLPSVLAYIVMGAGAAFFLQGNEGIYVAAEIGIVLLFFILGMEFPLGRMIDISRKVAPAGLLDVLFNLCGAMLIAWLFGLGAMDSFIIGSVCYATSSSIVAKMLEEKKRLANPEAEFLLALLIFEDLVAPLLVSFLAEASSGREMTVLSELLVCAKILLLFAGAVLMGHTVFKRLDGFVSKHLQKEFMPLLTVGSALLYAGVAISMGLSEILGAFLAGVMLSETGRSSELEHMIMPVRDLTLPFFFFWFGTTISLGEGIPFVGILMALLLWSVFGKVMAGYAGGRIYGLGPKASLRAGLSLVPRGEFSAVIAGLAPAGLKVFSGIFILASAFAGVFLFQRAPAFSSWFEKRFIKKGQGTKA
jgi:CPA2 family monovalent cation:H+ antiporter-2